VRGLSSTFNDHWTQPRLFYNSLEPVEQQFLINAIRFETSHLQSPVVKQNVLSQLNKVSNDVAARVATALGMKAPQPDPTFYHDNSTTGISITNGSLPTIATLRVGILATTSTVTTTPGNGIGTTGGGGNSSSSAASRSMDQAKQLKQRFAADGLVPVIVAESLAEGVDRTYSAADATDFDTVVVTSGADDAGIFDFPSSSSSSSGSGSGSSSLSLASLYPPMRPLQIANNAFNFGKPVAYFGAETPSKMLKAAGFVPGTGSNRAANGVFVGSDLDQTVSEIEDGLRVFKFTARFPLDS